MPNNETPLNTTNPTFNDIKRYGERLVEFGAIEAKLSAMERMEKYKYVLSNADGSMQISYVYDGSAIRNNVSIDTYRKFTHGNLSIVNQQSFKNTWAAGSNGFSIRSANTIYISCKSERYQIGLSTGKSLDIDHGEPYWYSLSFNTKRPIQYKINGSRNPKLNFIERTISSEPSDLWPGYIVIPEEVFRPGDIDFDVNSTQDNERVQIQFTANGTTLRLSQSFLPANNHALDYAEFIAQSILNEKNKYVDWAGFNINQVNL